MALRHALLTLLVDEDLSGYDLVQYFDGSVGFVWHAQHPQIYRELERLRREKLVMGRLVRQSGRPNKTVYSITPKGRTEILEWAATAAPPSLVKDGAFLRAFSYGRIDLAVARARLLADEKAHAARLAHCRNLLRLASLRPDDARRTGTVLTLQATILIGEAHHRWTKWARAFLEDTASAGAGVRSRRRVASGKDIEGTIPRAPTTFNEASQRSARQRASSRWRRC